MSWEYNLNILCMPWCMYTHGWANTELLNNLELENFKDKIKEVLALLATLWGLCIIRIAWVISVLSLWCSIHALLDVPPLPLFAIQIMTRHDKKEGSSTTSQHTYHDRWWDAEGALLVCTFLAWLVSWRYACAMWCTTSLFLFLVICTYLLASSWCNTHMTIILVVV